MGATSAWPEGLLLRRWNNFTEVARKTGGLEAAPKSEQRLGSPHTYNYAGHIALWTKHPATGCGWRRM